MISKKMSRITAALLLSTIMTSLSNNFLVSAAEKTTCSKQQTSSKSKKSAEKIAGICLGSSMGAAALAAVCYGLYCLFHKTEDPSTSKTTFPNTTFTKQEKEQVVDKLFNFLINTINSPREIMKINLTEKENKMGFIKLVFVGGTKTGKTTFSTCLCSDCPNIANFAPTVGSNFVVQNVDGLGMLIYDTPGSNQSRSAIPEYSRFANMVFLFTDPRNPEYINLLKSFYEIATEKAPSARMAVIINTYRYDNNEWENESQSVLDSINELNWHVPICEWHKVTS